MSLPTIVSREEWLAQRTALLTREKELTRERDMLNADRRRMGMVRVEPEYTFHGPAGESSLLDLFDGRRQLMVSHFMFDPEWEDGCPSCTAGIQEVSDGMLEHLHSRDTTFVVVSRAPLEKIQRYRQKMGWTVPWFSSHGSRFNYDYHVTLDPAVAPVEYNYRTADLPTGEMPGLSCFLRDGDAVFHTYSNYARGAEMTGGSYYFLDLTALGRQEDWEEPKDRHGDPHPGVPVFS